MQTLKKITVVGGGTAGFVSALILKTRFPHLDITLIESSRIGIIGVGEGSTEHWHEFMQYIGVPFRTVIKECDATFKCGIMFKGWSREDYLHSIGTEAGVKNGQYASVYGKLISEKAPNWMFNQSHSWENRMDSSRLEPDAGPAWNQYHFNTHKLNDFLHKVALEKKISVIEDEITDVVLAEDGSIDYLVGEKAQYRSDFYIDCTGFKKLLISKLGAKWQSYSEYLKMKAAIVFPIGDTDEYNIWTLAQAMDYGWMFKIPVWGRSGNGYIFDSDYITPEQAKDEVEDFLGHPIEVAKTLRFDPGALDKVWIKNCCAVGLSSSFVEPLEATSIGTSIQQVFLLMHRLPNYDNHTVEKYNKDIGDILTNLRDFVILHYVTKKDNSQFWLDIQKLKLPDTLENNLRKWRKNLPIAEDFKGSSDYKLFSEMHFIHIMNGLKLFDVSAIQHEYSMMHPAIKDIAEKHIREKRTLEKITPTVGHKAYISHIRDTIRYKT
jgi:tryptophan halogenase